LHIGLP